MPTRLASRNVYIAVGIGGMFGAVGRYSISVLMENRFLFPLETLTANLIGCFLLSFLLNCLWLKKIVSPAISTGLTTGAIGAFTTFSTFAVETLELATNHLLLSLIYVFISIVGGILLCYLGYRLANIGQVTL
ncbi:CrcB family protein [Paucisalibacillus sp. EB02]|uniref:fluoride efflux transporter FluC n=1 Tax=Paucisalibacillus sp. EB02 TaxID=1347087 RepID=UPI0004B542BC|nr:CrcB family protein [Paucisalibacillus sp. EB02]